MKLGSIIPLERRLAKTKVEEPKVETKPGETLSSTINVNFTDMPLPMAKIQMLGNAEKCVSKEDLNTKSMEDLIAHKRHK